MAKASKFTDQWKLEIALGLLGGKLSQAEICDKWDISSTYAYKIKDRALDIVRNGIGRPAGRSSSEVAQLRKQGGDLQELAGDCSGIAGHGFVGGLGRRTGAV